MICNYDSSIAINGIFVYVIVLAANANYLENPTSGSSHTNDYSNWFTSMPLPMDVLQTNGFSTFDLYGWWEFIFFLFVSNPTVNSDNPLLYLNSSLCLWSGTKNGQTFIGYQRSFPYVELKNRTATCFEDGSFSQISN